LQQTLAADLFIRKSVALGPRLQQLLNLPLLIPSFDTNDPFPVILVIRNWKDTHLMGRVFRVLNLFLQICV
jgi:hypothetical protein